jgi:hypothetical protein
VAQSRTLAADRRDLGGLVGVRREDRHGARIAEDVRGLFGGEVRVDRHVGDARRETGEVGDDPLRAVGRENRDAIARAHAERIEPSARAADAVLEHVVRDRW